MVMSAKVLIISNVYCLVQTYSTRDLMIVFAHPAAFFTADTKLLWKLLKEEGESRSTLLVELVKSPAGLPISCPCFF